MKIFRTVLLLISFTIVVETSAMNLNFLYEAAPIADFNEQDIKLMENAIEKALNEKRDGEKLAWKNDESSHSGLVNPLSTYSESEIICRTVRIVNKSSKRIAQNNFKFCKEGDVWILMNIIIKDE